MVWVLQEGDLCNPYINYYLLPLFPFTGAAVMVVIVWQLDLQLPVPSVPITTKVVSLNPAHGEVFLMQHYVIKFVSDLRQVSGFL